ncbi:MAG: family 20 glycosylhydrolase [Phycisphaerae bacterium]|nr:family 20 glycosylhydrolase [Phycisphaerae bacterium]
MLRHIAIILSLALMIDISRADEIKKEPWRGLHVMATNSWEVERLTNVIDQLANIGVNVIIAEINYGFKYKKHPELAAQSASSREQINKLVAKCKDNNIRLIPQFQCLGHQSWASHTNTFLTKYPQYDETPNKYPGNKGIYCRSWCPLHPEVNPIIFDLMDELIEAFQANALHVGLDEVFIIADDDCPRCKGKNKGELFAKIVNDYHKHLIQNKKVEMLMWGDRLIDASKMYGSKWEASDNGTHTAIDLIPKDIIICDWHYNLEKSYDSVPLFIKKGFRVLPASYKNTNAVNAYINYSKQQQSNLMLGHLNTVWGSVPTQYLPDFEPIRYTSKNFGGANEKYWQANPLLEPEFANLKTSSFRVMANLTKRDTNKPTIASIKPVILNKFNINKAQQWSINILPDIAENDLLGLSFPAKTASQPNDNVQFKLDFDLTGKDIQKGLALQIFLSDDLNAQEPNVGYRFYRILHEEKVIWQLDLAGNELIRGKWLEIPVAKDAIKENKLNLILEVIDVKGVGNYGCNILLGEIFLVNN